jgi:hypothetical protein
MQLATEILTQHVIPRDSVKHAANMALVNKQLNALLMKSSPGLAMWLDIARTLTGYYYEFETKEGVTMRKIKALLCPWLSDPVEIFEFPEDSMHTQRRIVVDAKTRTLSVYIEDDTTYMYSMTCDGNNVKVIEDDVELPPLPDEPAKTNTQAEEIFEEYNISNGTYIRYVVHKSVYAIMEYTETVERESIYFFCANSHRLLRQMRFPCCLQSADTTDICFLPMEMWVTTCGDIFYYGPDNKEVEPAPPESRIVQAQWDALGGKTEDVLSYLRENNLDINTPSVSFELTVLHNAALAGQVDTVRALIAAGANVNQPDILQRTPLVWAVHVWQPEVVRELIKAGANITPDVYEAIHDDGNIDAMMDTVTQLLHSEHAHMLFQNVHTQAVVQHIIRSGAVQTGPDILHTILKSVEDDDATQTVELFSDDDIKAVINGENALQLARRLPNVSESTVANLQARMWFA